MKRTAVIITVLSILLAAIALPSCNSPEKSIVGTWVAIGEDNTYIFSEDGTGKHILPLNTSDITYTIADGKITINDKALWVIDTTVEYTFELKGDTLKLTSDGKTTSFCRQPSGK